MSGSTGGFTPAQVSAIWQMLQAYQRPPGSGNPQAQAVQGPQIPSSWMAPTGGQAPGASGMPSMLPGEPQQAPAQGIPASVLRALNGGAAVPGPGMSPSMIAQPSSPAGSAIPGAASRIVNGGFSPAPAYGASPSMISQPSVPSAGALLPGGAPNPANINIQQLLQMMNGSGAGTSLPAPATQPPQSYQPSTAVQPQYPNPYAPLPPGGGFGQ